MKKIVSLIILLAVFMGFAQSQTYNRTIDDRKLEKKVYVGEVNLRGLKKGEMGEHYDGQYKGYSPDVNVIRSIKEHIDDVEILLIFGSWCHDSHEQVPRFMRVLNMLQFDMDKLTMIAVDSEKKAYVYPVQDKKIELVPTFIFYRDGEEIGRIIETPKKTLEKDLYKIVK